MKPVVGSFSVRKSNLQLVAELHRANGSSHSVERRFTAQLDFSVHDCKYIVKAISRRVFYDEDGNDNHLQ